MAVLLGSLIASMNLLAGETVWVRIFHGADHPLVATTRAQVPLEDYGSMQWGRMNPEQAEALRQQGLRMSVSENPFLVELGGERFDPLETASAVAAVPSQSSDGFHLVQFNGPVRAHWLQALRHAGLEIVQPLHPFSFFVWGNPGQLNAVRNRPEVRASAAMVPPWKVQPGQRHYDAELRATMALVSSHVDPRELVSDLSRYGHVRFIRPLNRHFRLVHMELPGNLYAQVAELPAVYTVQYIRPEAGPRGEMSNQSVVGAVDDSGTILPGYLSWLESTGYRGEGIRVGVVDGGIRSTHVDLASNMAPCIASGDSPSSCTSAPDNHGTHVAGAIAGTGISATTRNGFTRGLGMAPSASLVQQRYLDFLGVGPGQMLPDGMLKIFRESALSGALLTNNSWGPTATPQGYDIPTQQIDFIARDADPATPGRQPILAVWAIMNGFGDGGGNCAPSSLGSPDEAKNLLAVGSTLLQTGTGMQSSNIFALSSNSGHGPACDGRRVPHIVAPGCNTDSTVSGSDTAHGLSCGTSMAAPIVSGAVAIWAQHHRSVTGRDPSPALVKAIFTASAQNLEGQPNANGLPMGHRPDRFQGFGRLDLDAIINHNTAVFAYDQETVFTAAGQDWSVPLDVVDPDRPVAITLAWTDAPGHGLGGSTPAWVNNLDLVVEAGGQVYLGNVIGADGWSQPGGQADWMNNLEGVFLNPAQHQGGVDITVLASDLTGDALNPWDPDAPSQDFALVCHNCLLGNPTFNIATLPISAVACTPDQGVNGIDINLNLSPVGNYMGQVSLAASNLPAGVGALFSPAIVSPPGHATLTLEIDNTASPGPHLLNIIGDDGQILREREYELILEAPSAAVVLHSPSDQSSDLSLQPAFSWQALAGIDDYRIQIADNPDFSTPLVDQLLSETNFTPAQELAMGSQYYWRVQAWNSCGGGTWSDDFGFTTRLEPVAEFSAQGFNFTLNPDSRLFSTLEITNSGTGNLTFELEIDAIAAMLRKWQFEESALLSSWELSESAPGVNGSVSYDNGPPQSLLLTGGDDGVGGNTDLVVDIPVDGTIRFDWGYQTEDDEAWDSGGYVINGDYTVLAINAEPVPFFDQSVQLAVLAGDQFAFRVNTVDGLQGPGTLGIASLEFIPAACEELTQAAWLSVFPTSGSIGESLTQVIEITADSSGLSDGEYLSHLCIHTNDPDAVLVELPITLTVDSMLGVEDQVFEDRFETDSPD
jgi:serine protease AprX